MRYTLYTWPESQAFIGNEKCILVCPDEKTGLDLDSSYMVPEDEEPESNMELDDDKYIRLQFPESQRFESDEELSLSCIHDYEGGLFVPISIYNKKAADTRADNQIKKLISGMSPAAAIKTMGEIFDDTMVSLRDKLIEALQNEGIKMIDITEISESAIGTVKDFMTLDRIVVEERDYGIELVLECSDSEDNDRVRFANTNWNMALEVRDICFRVIGDLRTEELSLNEKGEVEI